MNYRILQNELKESKRQQRTETILNRERNNKEEFARLHAILCLDFQWESGDCIAFGELVDTVQIAARLDEINQQTQGYKPFAACSRFDRLEAATQANKTDLSKGSFELLELFVDDKDNWCGMPMLGVNFEMTPERKGHLSDLIKKGYVHLHEDEENFIIFTNKAKNLFPQVEFED